MFSSPLFSFGGVVLFGCFLVGRWGEVGAWKGTLGQICILLLCADVLNQQPQSQQLCPWEEILCTRSWRQHDENDLVMWKVWVHYVKGRFPACAALVLLRCWWTQYGGFHALSCDLKFWIWCAVLPCFWTVIWKSEYDVQCFECTWYVQCAMVWVSFFFSFWLRWNVSLSI